MPNRQGVSPVPFDVIAKSISILLEIRGEMDHLGWESEETREKAVWEWLTTPPLPYKRLGDILGLLRPYLPDDYYSMSDEESKQFHEDRKRWEAKIKQKN